MSGELLSAQTVDEVVAVIGRAMRTAFGSRARVLLRRAGGLAPEVEGSEGAVAQWALSAWEPAGIGTKHFPEAAGLYLPLVGSHGRVGVLELRPDDRTRFSEPVVLWLLQVCAAQAALALERSLAAKLGPP